MDKGLEIQEILKNIGFNVVTDWNSRFFQKGNLRLYVKCNNCGHVCHRAVSDLRKGKFFCDGCFIVDVNNKLKTKNFSAIDISTDTYKINCNVCGTCRTITKSALYDDKNKIDCEGCRNNLYTNRCDQMNATYMYDIKVTNGRNVFFKCNRCGDITFRMSSVLLQNNFDCTNCRILKYKDILAEKSCTYVEHNSERIIYKTEFGEVRSCSSTSLHRRSFLVSDYKINKRPHSVYVLRLDFNSNIYYKIGVAHNIKSRIISLKLSGNVQYTKIGIFNSREDAVRFEKSLHKKFKNLRLDPKVASEFSNNIRRNKLMEAPSKDGVTEWFNADIFKYLFEEDPVFEEYFAKYKE